MHVLMTSDTVGGVWTYTQELVTGLVHSGHRVTLVSFGKLPLPHQTAWMRTLPNLDYRPTEYALEWMEVAAKDIEESARYLQMLVDEVQPDLLHLSQYCYGDLATQKPKIVVAHSDVVSWWVAVHGREPEDSPWMRRYREQVIQGLRGADMVVAPSKWMLDRIALHYIDPANTAVINNGRTPTLFDAESQKEDFTLSVGRIWDAAKNASLLLEEEMPGRICIVGWEKEPGREAGDALLNTRKNVELLGPKSQDELRSLYATASTYAATSRYEPFGLAPLEAAFSHCVLVMNDNPVFHELWGDAALYFRKDQSEDLARVLGTVRGDSASKTEYASRSYRRAFERFTAERMVEQYESVYQQLCSHAGVA